LDVVYLSGDLVEDGRRQRDAYWQCIRGLVQVGGELLDHLDEPHAMKLTTRSPFSCTFTSSLPPVAASRSARDADESEEHDLRLASARCFLVDRGSGLLEPSSLVLNALSFDEVDNVLTLAHVPSPL
jgi:hypothetical protein